MSVVTIDQLSKESYTNISTVSGVPWQVRPSDDRLAVVLSQKYDLPQVVGKLLAARGIGIDDVEDFLNPSLRNLLPDPFHLMDMDKAVERIIMALHNKENIIIFGDYDVDGATSSALLVRYFRMLGHDAEIYIPDRMAEGYGPNAPALLKLKEKGADLVITVDCGAVAFDALAVAAEAGLDVIVMDHHLGSDKLPLSVAVVNPNRLDETSQYTYIAAVGVCFLLVVAVTKKLREAGYFSDRKEPEMLSLLDIVALGTVCDVMPLKGLNRAFVKQGLKILAKRRNTGLAALMDVSGLQDLPDSYHLGFMLGPRINAGGRVGKSDLGSRLLSSEDFAETEIIAQELDVFNQERRAIEVTVLEEAMAQAEQLAEAAPFIVVQKEGWHPGVIGIVAGRIKEKYNKPVAVIALENGVGKASVRSVSGVDIGAAIIAARMEGLLVAGGGHAMAAGFTIEQSKIEEFTEFVSVHIKDSVQSYSENRSFKFDGELSPAAVNTDLVVALEQLAPFGMGNPRPQFIMKNARIVKVDILKEKHLRCIVTEGGPHPMPSARVKAMSFNTVGTDLGNMLMSSKGKDIYLAGEVKRNVWNGNVSAEFFIKDMAVM